MKDFQNLTGFMDLLMVVEEKIRDKSSIITIGSAVLFMVVGISFLSTKRMGMDTSFAFASFMGFITSFFLLYLGFINMGVFVFMMILLFVSFTYLVYKKRERGR